MTELQVSCKVDGLAACNEGNGFEDDIGNGSSWKYVTTDELVHSLRGYLLIGDGLKHRKRNGKNHREYDTNDGSPDRELGGNDFDGCAEEGEGNGADEHIPPHGNFRIVLHETRVNVAFVL